MSRVTDQYVFLQIYKRLIPIKDITNVDVIHFIEEFFCRTVIERRVILEIIVCGTAPLSIYTDLTFESEHLEDEEIDVDILDDDAKIPFDPDAVSPRHVYSIVTMVKYTDWYWIILGVS